MRRDRAARSGPVLFLYEREFEEILERLSGIKRGFESALVVGAPDPRWPERLRSIVGQVTAVDPGGIFAAAAGAKCANEEVLDFDPGSFDLCLAVGTLDTVNALPEALLRLRFLLQPDSLLIGVISGGDTLPMLRHAMRAADSAMGAASPHVHPRIEPSALAGLLSSAGFAMPVVDVERVRVAYRSFGQLVADLRGMGVTNVVAERSRAPLTRAALAAAEAAFAAEAMDGRTTEVFELLHFAAWTAAEAKSPTRR
jgi:SAM-dependent methyltransferase